MSNVFKYTLIFFIIDVLGTFLYLWFLPPPPPNRVVLPMMGPLILLMGQGIIGSMLAIGTKYKKPGQGMVLAAGLGLLIGLAVCAGMV